MHFARGRSLVSMHAPPTGAVGGFFVQTRRSAGGHLALPLGLRCPRLSARAIGTSRRRWVRRGNVFGIRRWYGTSQVRRLRVWRRTAPGSCPVPAFVVASRGLSRLAGQTPGVNDGGPARVVCKPPRARFSACLMQSACGQRSRGVVGTPQRRFHQRSTSPREVPGKLLQDTV